MSGRKVIVAGATGVVGHAAMAHFAAQADCEVVALSRRAPRRTYGARHVPLDLADAAACRALSDEWRDATHVVYAALYERPELVAGWLDATQIARNRAMFANLLDAVLDAARDLRHVTLLQGTKAYGAHARRMTLPAREDRDEAYDVPNFYWQQERHLKARAEGRDWRWTILRPVLIVGEAAGGAMDLIPPLGVYAALLAEAGQPLHYPGGPERVAQAIDAEVLARAIDWAGRTPGAHGQAFNITNGDVYAWPNVWPAVAAALGMAAGEARTFSLAENLPERTADWRALAERHGLVEPDLMALVGLSFQYADYQLGYGRDRPGRPTLVSDVKLRQAGFHETIDTEVMLAKWLRRAQANRLLPPR
jgi:nucleoside-diphosphate-sugar epimerase